MPEPTTNHRILSPIELAQRRAAMSARWHGADAEKTLNLRRELKEAKLTAYIEQVVAIAPPFTDEQIDRLAALLRPAE
jgi:hypothetical protein